MVESSVGSLHGFELREEMLKFLSSKSAKELSFVRSKDSLGRDHFIRMFASEMGVPNSTFIDLQLISILNNEFDPEKLTENLDTVCRKASANYLGAMVMGIYSKDVYKKHIPISSAIDRSIYHQGQYFHGLHDNQNCRDCIIKLTKAAYKQWKCPYPIGQISELERIFKFFDVPLDLQGISGFYKSCKKLAHRSWPIMGPEFAQALAMLVSSKTNYEETAFYSTIEAFGLAKIRRQFSILKDCSEKVFYPYKLLPSDFFIETDVKQTEHELSKFLGSRIRKKYIRSLDGEFFENSAVLFYQLHHSIIRRRPERIYRIITLLFSLDPFLINFIDMRKLGRVLPDFTLSNTYGKAFVDMLFCKDANIISRGEGAFTATFSALMKQHSKSQKQISAVTGISSELPHRAAKELFQFLLEPSILQDIVFSLPSPSGASMQVDENMRENVKLELLKSVNTLQLISIGKKHDYLSVEQYDEIFEDERLNMALIRFKKNLQKGRIRVSKPFIEDQVEYFVEAIIKRIRYNKDNIEKYEDVEISWFASLFIVNVAELINNVLFDKPNSLDRLLSSNIRHGMIDDRFQACFLEAVKKSSPHKFVRFDWEDSLIVRHLGGEYDELTQLKKEILDVVHTFIFQDLTINMESDIVYKLNQSIEEILVKSLDEPGRELEAFLERELVGAISTMVHQFLVDAQKKYNTMVVPGVDKLLNLYKEQKRAANISHQTNFLDSLESSLEDVHQDILSWLKISDESDDVGEFLLGDVVLLEADIVHCMKKDELSLSITNSVEVSDGVFSNEPIKAEGTFFHLIAEVVHNLMSNAIKHSKQKYKTKITFEFFKKENSLTVVCINTADESVEKDLTVEKLEKLNSRINVRSSSRVGGFQGGSGFVKMVDACLEARVGKPVFFIKKARRGEVSVSVEISGI